MHLRRSYFTRIICYGCQNFISFSSLSAIAYEHIPRTNSSKLSRTKTGCCLIHHVVQWHWSSWENYPTVIKFPLGQWWSCSTYRIELVSSFTSFFFLPSLVLISTFLTHHRRSPSLLYSSFSFCRLNTYLNNRRINVWIFFSHLETLPKHVLNIITRIM